MATNTNYKFNWVNSLRTCRIQTPGDLFFQCSQRNAACLLLLWEITLYRELITRTLNNGFICKVSYKSCNHIKMHFSSFSYLLGKIQRSELKAFKSYRLKQTIYASLRNVGLKGDNATSTCTITLQKNSSSVVHIHF